MRKSFVIDLFATHARSDQRGAASPSLPLIGVNCGVRFGVPLFFTAFLPSRTGIDMTQTRVIVATIVAHAGQQAAVKAALELVVPPSRAEAGCVRYDLHQDVANPVRFVMLEEWRDAAAIDSHGKSAHFQALVKAIGALADIDITTHTKIA
jgi:quinol monooxygenase YgiN